MQLASDMWRADELVVVLGHDMCRQLVPGNEI